MAALEFGDGPLQHGLPDDHFADQIHHRVDARGVHAQRVFRAAWARPPGAAASWRFIVLDLDRVAGLAGFHAGGNRGGFRLDQDFQQVARRGLQRPVCDRRKYS